MAQHHWLTVGSIYQSTIIQSIWQGTILQMMLPDCNCDTLEDNKLAMIPSYDVCAHCAWAKGSCRILGSLRANPWFSIAHRWYGFPNIICHVDERQLLYYPPRADFCACASKRVTLSVQSIVYKDKLNIYNIIKNDGGREPLLISIGHCESLHCCDTRRISILQNWLQKHHRSA